MDPRNVVYIPLQTCRTGLYHWLLELRKRLHREYGTLQNQSPCPSAHVRLLSHQLPSCGTTGIVQLDLPANGSLQQKTIKHSSIFETMDGNQELIHRQTISH